MQIYIPDETTFATIEKICDLVGHDWRETGRRQWCKRCGLPRVVKEAPIGGRREEA